MQKVLCFILIGVVIFGCTRSSDPEVRRWEEQAQNVIIIRDDFGVPHIYGKTDADAVFGLLFAQCEDDFLRVERNFMTAIGCLAASEGESAIYSDLRAKLFMTEKEAKDYLNAAPEWLQKLCRAWADGINYYLYTHPEEDPKVIRRFEPWMTMYFTEGSIGGDIERVSMEKLKRFYMKNEPFQAHKSTERSMEEPTGSNGIAISGQLTASGNAMLLINPHTSFYFRGEVHVISEEGLNAYGAVTWGQFFIYQGFNENTGWMHTSTYTDVIDEFVETMIETEGRLMYLYGNEKRPVETFTVAIPYKDGDEGFREKKFTAYRTHHGPITHVYDNKWTATSLMWNPVKALEQSYMRMKTKDHEAFKEVMNIRTNSSNNTVFADSEGNIAYYHGNFIPKRDTAFDYTKPVNGSDPATDWQGLHSVEEAITVLNPPNGWIQNCNSTPFTCAAGYSPKKEKYPDYMSRIPENFRGVHAIRLLSKAKDLTLSGLIELAYDPYLPAFEKVIPGLIDAYDRSSKDPSLSEAIQTLREWDMKTSKTSVGMTLAHFYGMELYQNVAIPEHLAEMDRFNYFGVGLKPSERLHTFSMCIRELTGRFGSWKIPWGEVNRFQRLPTEGVEPVFDDLEPSTSIGLTSARWGSLAAYGNRSGKKTKKKIRNPGKQFCRSCGIW